MNCKALPANRIRRLAGEISEMSQRGWDISASSWSTGERIRVKKIPYSSRKGTSGIVFGPRGENSLDLHFNGNTHTKLGGISSGEEKKLSKSSHQLQIMRVQIGTTVGSHNPSVF